MIEPFLSLCGRSSEAIEYYEQVFNAKAKSITRFKDVQTNQDFQVPDEMKEYILHGVLNVCGTNMHFSDTLEQLLVGNLISLSVKMSDVAEAEEVFNSLKSEGEVLIPLELQSSGGVMFGWVRDKFGVEWQLSC